MINQQVTQNRIHTDFSILLIQGRKVYWLLLSMIKALFTRAPKPWLITLCCESSLGMQVVFAIKVWIRVISHYKKEAVSKIKFRRSFFKFQFADLINQKSHGFFYALIFSFKKISTIKGCKEPFLCHFFS